MAQGLRELVGGDWKIYGKSIGNLWEIYDWLVVTGTMEFWMTFPSYWEQESQLTNSIIFQRGRYTTNQTCFHPPDSAWLSWTGKNGKNGKGTVLNWKWHSRSDPTPRRASWHATENLEGTRHLNAVCANHETILTAFRSWILCLKHILSIVTTEKDRKVISYYILLIVSIIVLLLYTIIILLLYIIRYY